MDFGAGRDQIEDNTFRLLGIGSADGGDSVGLESGCDPRNARRVRHSREPTIE